MGGEWKDEGPALAATRLDMAKSFVSLQFAMVVAGPREQSPRTLQANSPARSGTRNRGRCLIRLTSCTKVW